MPQPTFEEILGPPNANVMQSAGLDGLAMVGYLCLLPDSPTAVNPPQFIEMTGPHFPGEK